MEIFGFLCSGVFFLVGLVLSGLLFIIWIWMLIDCVTKEPSEGNDKLIWVLIILLTWPIGPLIYLFLRRPQRIRQYGR